MTSRGSVPVKNHPMRQHAAIRQPPDAIKKNERRVRVKNGTESIEEAQGWARKQPWWPRVWHGEVWWDARCWVWLLVPGGQTEPDSKNSATT